MNVYYFGNKDLNFDKSSYDVVTRIKDIEGIEFIEVLPNQDLPFVDIKDVVIMDVVEDLNSVRLVDLSDFDSIQSPRSATVHDFDLGFQLKYLKKLGKIQSVRIVCLPGHLTEADYKTVQSIFKKLVAQDIQGS